MNQTNSRNQGHEVGEGHEMGQRHEIDDQVTLALASFKVQYVKQEQLLVQSTRAAIDAIQNREATLLAALQSIKKTQIGQLQLSIDRRPTQLPQQLSSLQRCLEGISKEIQWFCEGLKAPYIQNSIDSPKQTNTYHQDYSIRETLKELSQKRINTVSDMSLIGTERTKMSLKEKIIQAQNQLKESFIHSRPRIHFQTVCRRESGSRPESVSRKKLCLDILHQQSTTYERIKLQ